MIKRLLPLLLAAVITLCACGDNNAYVDELHSVVADHNASDRKGGSYLLEIYVGDEAATTLYYAHGDFACDKTAKKAYTSFSQSWFGFSSKAENYFADGIVTNITDGEVITTERSAEELLSMFPYLDAPFYGDDCFGLARVNNSRGYVYTYTCRDGKGISESVVGGDLYQLAYVIKDPQPEKTVYGDVVCSAGVSDGKLTSLGFEFDVTLFDTPSYVPGYSQPESEYSLTMHIVAKVNYSDEFELKEYEK